MEAVFKFQWLLLLFEVSVFITQEIREVDASTTFPTVTEPPTTGRSENDTNKYYTSSVDLMGEEYYEEHGESGNTVAAVSNGFRTAWRVPISFKFPFYGWEIESLLITSGGFISTANFTHQWLSATEYIAPLMANFDPSLNDSSVVIYKDTGNAFHVWWENVFLHDDVAAGPFTFMVTLQRDGQIRFAYKEIPKNPINISANEHPVKVGLSDAYYVDVDQNGQTLRYIYEYNTVDVNFSSVIAGSAVHFTPITGQCLDHYDSSNCSAWARRGECLHGRVQWMLRHCACSCATVQPTTTDYSYVTTRFTAHSPNTTTMPHVRTTERFCWNLHQPKRDCEAWAARGDCWNEDSREWMMENCYQSCTHCVAPTPSAAAGAHVKIFIQVYSILVALVLVI